MSANATMATAQPPITTSPRSARLIHGSANDGRPCGSGPSTFTPALSSRPNAPTATVAPTTAIRMPGIRSKRLSSRIAASVPAPTANAVQFSLAAQHRFSDLREVAQRPDAVDRKAEQLGQLADQHRERDAVHVTVADRLGQQLGDEPQAHHSYQDAHQPRNDRHRARQGHGPHRIATRERQHDRENHRGKSGVRPQHQNAAGTEQRISEQRDDSGVQTVDSRDARSHCVGDSDRHQHRGQHQAGHQIVRQPGGFVPAEDLQSGQPTLPAVHALSFEWSAFKGSDLGTSLRTAPDQCRARAQSRMKWQVYPPGFLRR